MAKEQPDNPIPAEPLTDERPTDALMGKLWDLNRQIKRRSAARASAEAETDAPVADVHHLPVGETADFWDLADGQGRDVPASRDRPVEARLRAAAHELATKGQAAGFDAFALTPSNEFPSQLTRLPIFRPSQRRTQQLIQDLDNAVAFETPWGRGRRLGPPLTVRDEDTLIALMRLRDHALRGPESRLPANVRDIYQSSTGTSEVHRVVCSLGQLLDELGLSDSGTNFKNLLASIKRLAGASIEIEKVNLPENSTAGGTFNLIQLRWVTFEDHGLVDVVFPPMMAHWLRHSYTYIDWKVRLQLPPLAKAIHRFLSGQRTSYSIELGKLAGTIGYDGRREHMRKKFAAACDELVATGWMTRYRIRGTGRGKSPWILEIERG